jgi:glucokinase
MSRYAIGADIGGTNLKLALVNDAGQIHRRESHPTPQGSDPQAIVAGIVAATRGFLDRAREAGYAVEGIGFTVPHFFEGENWSQRQTNNVPALEGFDLRPPLAAEFGESIAMINDLSAAGIAEHMYGQGRGYDRMLLLAIGTGIATAFVNESGLVDFNYGSTGDTGHMIVDPDGMEPCTCGGRGCLEALVSAQAIRKRALSEVRRGKPTRLADILQEKGDLEARDVSEAARGGDAVARDVLAQAGHFLGVAMTSLLHIFRPSLIVLGGGVSQAGDLLIEPMRATMNRLASPWYLARLQGIELSALGVNGGAVGCASLILYPGRYLHST